MTETDTPASGAAGWALSATCRCLTEDLDLASDACDRRIEDLADAHRVIADFVKKRGAHPIGNETIQALLPTLVAYSLHSGRYRAATWHHEAAGIVWLLAAHWHEQGRADDAYPYFERLLHQGHIWPTRADVERIVKRRRSTFEGALLDDVPRLRRAALDQPGRLQEGIIGGRVRVRVGFEDGDSGLLCVAIAQRLIPGELALPVEWHVQILAAFFPGVPLEDIGYTHELAGRDLQVDEHGYCALISETDRTGAG